MKFEGRPPVPRHVEPPLPRCLLYALFHSTCSSFLSAWAKSIHHLIDSSSHPVNPIRSGKQFFLCYSLNTVGINSLSSSLLVPPMHHGKGVSQMLILSHLFTFYLINLIDLDDQNIMN